MPSSEMLILASKDDDLNRLREVHSDVRDYMENERRHSRYRFIFFISLLLILLIIILMDRSRASSFIDCFVEKFCSSFVVEDKEMPQDGKMIPLPCGRGGNPLMIQEKLPEGMLTPRMLSSDQISKEKTNSNISDNSSPDNSSSKKLPGNS